MANIENERLVEEELAAIEQNEEQMANCKHVLELVEKLSRPNPSEVSDAETNMEGLWMTNPRLLIDSMLNILTSKKFTELNDTVHQALCVTLSIYLSKYPLDSDKNEDVSTLINWLNRMSYSFFKVTESSVKLKRICLPFAKLFMFWDFYIDDSFSREVYFRFLKKNFAEAQTETKLSSLFTNLGKLLILLEVFSSEDDKLLTSSLPMLLTDSVSSLCMCSVTLCKEFSTSSKEIILEYVQNINIMIEKLLDVLVTSFGKFSSQGLDILANQDLKNHLLMMNEFVELTEVKALGIENCLVLKTPVVKIVNSLVTVACRFELDIKEQAQKYQEKVVEMISRYNFKDTFNSLLIWINKAMADMILLGLSVSPSDPQSAKDYYHCSLELMAQSILLPALSLDLQREADKIFLKVITPTIVAFEIPQAAELTLNELFITEQNIYDPSNYDSILSCSVSLLMRIIDLCGFSRRVADLLVQLSKHLTGEQSMKPEDLAEFIPQANFSSDKLPKAFLVIFNACARRFSQDSDLSQTLVVFYQEYYFRFFKDVRNDPQLLYRLVFLIRNSIQCLDLLSGKSFIDIFNHLTGFLKEKDNQAMDQEMYPEAITGLSLEVLKKFISNKDLCKKLRVYSYETLSCLDSITSCKLESYFGFIERLLQSPIAKDYAKYASKIMNLITKRIEIEYIACSRAGLKTNIYIDRCLSLVSTVLSIKDVLEEQFEGIESELAKIFLFMSCKDVDFASEIISIAGTIVRVAGCHLSIMTPVVQSFDRLYILCNYELTDLYQVFYNYILKDSNFVLHEGRSAARTTLGGWVEEERNQIASSSSIDLEKTPFRCINKVLLQVIRGAYSEPSKQHITTVQKALMLIIMEFQIWNEAGLLSNYRDILAELYCLLESLENTFEKARESTTEEVYVLYIWTSLALLNAFHYYYEEVSQEMLKTGFLIRFINKGAELISSVYIELPIVLKKLYQLSLIRLLSSSAELELNIQSIAYIVNLITAILGEEIPTEEQEMQEFLGNKKKRVNSKNIKKAGKLNKDQENGTNFKAIKDSGFEERLTSGASLVPNHEPKDFYIMGVNLFGYFQHTYQKLKQSNDQFTQALKSLLAPDQLSVLNDVLSATVLNISTNLVSLNPKSHLMKEEINHQNTVRKIAKVVRRPGQDRQTQNKTMIAENGN